MVSDSGLLFFLVSLFPFCRSETTLYYTDDTMSHRWGSVQGQYGNYGSDGWGGYGSGYNSGYSYYDVKNNNQNTVMKFDPVSQRYVVTAVGGCSGQMVDYVGGQQRFYCNCGQYGGVSYQIGGCRSTMEDHSFEAMERRPKNQGFRYVWDPASGRYKLGAQTECNGKWIDNVNGQMRFLCDCGMFGGMTYQIGTCQPTIPTLKSLGLPQSAGKK